MMKLLSCLLLICSTTLALAADGKKIYSEEEYVKKVFAEVKKKVDSIKLKSVSDLTRELLDKEEQLKLREIELQKHQDSIKVSEGDITRRYSELAHKQKSFIGCVERNNEEGKARIGQLVDMVSNMKPQKAADVLSVQDSDVAVQILQLIDPKKASKIFNFMDKDTSAKLQKQYLQMKK